MLHLTVPDAGIRTTPTPAHREPFAELRKNGDALYYAGIGALFSGSDNASNVLRWKDMYDVAHQALVRCADATDALTRIGE